MFNKKKKPIQAMHYEGINDFSTNYPCTLELTDENLIIKRIQPETTVTLPRNRIKSFSALGEAAFLQQYKGTAFVEPQNYIPKYYLVIQYDKGTLVFWGTVKLYKKFLDLQYNGVCTTPSNIEL